MAGKFDAEIVVIYTDLVLVERKLKCEMYFLIMRFLRNILQSHGNAGTAFRISGRKRSSTIKFVRGDSTSAEAQDAVVYKNYEFTL